MLIKIRREEPSRFPTPSFKVNNLMLHDAACLFIVKIYIASGSGLGIELRCKGNEFLYSTQTKQQNFCPIKFN